MSKTCNRFLPVEDPTEEKRKKDSVMGAKLSHRIKLDQILKE